jgi:hypothetical protein
MKDNNSIKLKWVEPLEQNNVRNSSERWTTYGRWRT